MLNRLKYKESNILVDIWFAEKLQQERSGKFNVRLGKWERQWRALLSCVLASDLHLSAKLLSAAV